MMSLHRFSPGVTLFNILSWQTIRQSSQFSRPKIRLQRAPAFSGDVWKSVSLEDVTLFAGKRSYAPDLSTALEGLAQDQCRSIRWFHPHASIDSAEVEADVSGTDDDAIEIERMPLYPMEAVHIPFSGENCTIVNIEPKNVKLATDLINGKWKGSLFCASLQARDTTRIASVGTLLQVLDTEDRSIAGAKTWPGKALPTLHRVVANCRAIGIVDILSIEEKDYEEEDYLVAWVKVRNLPGTIIGDGLASKKVTEGEGFNFTGNEDFDSIAKQIIDDYQKVRSIYINSQSLASNELPKFARQAVQTLPIFDANVTHDETRFWKLVETWQMLCNTIRQAKQAMLQSVVNELSVAAALRTKGPLELPVRRRRLPLEVRRQLEDVEYRAARDFVELGMEPILDFQEILTATGRRGRMACLGRMLARERARLEAKESLIQALTRECGEGGVPLAANGPSGFD